MKILLTSLNAKFIHTSLALYSLKAYSKEYKSDVKIEEFTINNDLDYCLTQIVKYSPDVIGFSTYIWNVNETMQLIQNLKKVLPQTKIVLGGPEVSFNSMEFLKSADFVIKGEGEKPFYELLLHLDNKKNIHELKSICYKTDNTSVETELDKTVSLSDIGFAYEEIDSFKNKIIYYESSRGCPYSCAYCLSSSTKGVRFLDEKRVKSDLSFFLENRPKQVKFVDRTFNANPKHAIMIWKYLIENDNGVTNFHFEISADTITDEMIDVLKNARYGLFQFEIGVQTTNECTLKEIDRKIDTQKIFDTVKKVQNLKNIHIHLDLIAGLPFENFASFSKSFSDTYSLYPDKLQLGFLKLLKGSSLRTNSDKYGIIYRDYAPYEVLKTNDISYLELETLKGIEFFVDIYYNSHKYDTSIKYAETLYTSPFNMYFEFENYFIKNNLLKSSMPKSFYQSFLYTVTEDEFLKECLRFDLYKQENMANMPEILKNDEISIFRESSENIYSNQVLFKSHIEKGITKKQYIRNSRIEKFKYDIIKYIDTKHIVKKDTFILFDYYHIMDPIVLDEVILYEEKR